MSKPGYFEDKDAVLKAIICQRRQLLSIAKRILRCPFLAEDVVQDAAVKASLMQCERTIACPIQFAKSMVRNLAIDQARRLKLEGHHFAPETGSENLPLPCADPCSRLEVCEAIDAVFRALDELPDRTHRVFERVRIEGMSQKSVAAELGVSPTLVHFMVQSAHRHCLARLQLLNDHEYGSKSIESASQAPSRRRLCRSGSHGQHPEKVT